MSNYLLATATRLDRRDFWTQSLLGRSLCRVPETLRPDLAIAFGNSDPVARGLPTIYNRAIEKARSSAKQLVLCHDDAWIHDPLFLSHLDDAFKRFDVVGVAGSRGAKSSDVSWLLDSHLVEGVPVFNGQWMTERPNFVASGIVSHGCSEDGNPPPYQPSIYGKRKSDECTLLDGVFLACSSRALSSSACRFSEHEALRFHLYDLDFCRRLGTTGLSLGTWPIAITHESGGNFGSAEFQRAAIHYLDQWNEPDSSDAPPARASA